MICFMFVVFYIYAKQDPLADSQLNSILHYEERTKTRPFNWFHFLFRSLERLYRYYGIRLNPEKGHILHVHSAYDWAFVKFHYVAVSTKTWPWRVRSSALFLRLNQTSTLICRVHRAFRKRTQFKPEEFENFGFSFFVCTEKKKTFGFTVVMCFPANVIPKWSLIVNLLMSTRIRLSTNSVKTK